MTWEKEIPSGLRINGSYPNLGKGRQFFDLGAMYPDWSQWICPQGPDAMMLVWLLKGFPVWIQIHNTSLTGQITVHHDGVDTLVDPMSGWCASNQAWLEYETTSLHNRMDGNAAADDAADYEDPAVTAITGSGGVDRHSTWFSLTEVDGWSSTMVRYAAEYLALQVRRPEWPMYPASHKLAGQLMVLNKDENFEPLKPFFKDAWKTNSAGLAFNDAAHFDTCDMYEIARQKGWPMADWQLLGRVFRAMRLDYYWQTKKLMPPYGGQTRVIAYLLESAERACRRTEIMADSFGLQGFVDLREELIGFLVWHQDYGIVSFPIAHPYGEGGGNDIMADAKKDFFSVWQIGVLAGSAYIEGCLPLMNMCLDWLETYGWNSKTGEVYESVSSDYTLTAPGKPTQTWPLFPLWEVRPDSPLTRRLLQLVPENDVTEGKYAFKFGVRLAGAKIDEFRAARAEAIKLGKQAWSSEEVT